MKSNWGEYFFTFMVLHTARMRLHGLLDEVKQGWLLILDI